jgi:hypothetical protein
MTINFRSGLHRLYFVLCVTWLLGVLVGYPLYLRDQRLSSAFEIEKTHATMMNEMRAAIKDPKALDEIAKADMEIVRADREAASLANIYTDMWNDRKSVLLALVLPPVVLYAVLAGTSTGDLVDRSRLQKFQDTRFGAIGKTSSQSPLTPCAAFLPPSR